MLFWGNFPYLTRELVAQIQRIKEKDPFAPIDILILSNTMRRVLKENLANQLGVFSNVFFYTKIDLARQIHSQKPSLSPYDQRLLIRALQKEKNQHSESYIDECVRLIREIKENRKEDRLAEIKKSPFYFIYQDYEELKTRYGFSDREDYLKTSAQIFFKKKKDSLQYDNLLVFGFKAITPLDEEFFISLIPLYRYVALFNPILPDLPVFQRDAVFLRTHRFFLDLTQEPPLFEPAALQDSYPNRLFTNQFNLSSLNETKLKILSNRGRNEEIEKIAKIIVKAVSANPDLRYYRIGVILSGMENYLTKIQNTFSQYHIPFTIFQENRYRDNPDFFRIIQLFSLKDGCFERTAVLSALKPKDIKGLRDIDSFDLELDAKEFGVAQGIAVWEAFCKEKGYGALNALLAQLEAIPDTAHIRDFVHLFEQTLKDFYPELYQSDDDNYIKRILSFLSDIESNPILKLTVNELTRAEFLELFFLYFENEEKTEQEKGDVVEIRTPTNAEGLIFDLLIIAGLNDGVYPSAIREGIVVTLEEREAMQLPNLDRLSQEQIAAFYHLIQSAGEVYLSYLSADEEGLEMVPSLLIEEVRRAVLGKHYYLSDSNPELNERLDFKTERLALLGHEYVLNGIIDKNPRIGSLSPVFGRVIERERARFGESLAAFDGCLSKFDCRGISLSPSKIQTFAKCPYPFYIQSVLELRELPERDLTQIPPDELGTMVHKLLELFYTEDWEGLATLGEDSLKGLAETLFHELWVSHFRNYYGEKVREIRDWALRGIVEFLVEDVQLLKANQRRPVYLEKKVEMQRCGFLWRGTIDRIDADGNGNHWIVDYKSGKNREINVSRFIQNSIQKGYSMQCFLYPQMLSLRSLSASLVFVFEKGARQRVEVFSERVDKEKTERMLDDYSEMIKHGRFAPYPKSKACLYCPYGDFCGKSRASDTYLLNREAGDDYYSRYVAVQEGDDKAEEADGD